MIRKARQKMFEKLSELFVFYQKWFDKNEKILGIFIILLCIIFILTPKSDKKKEEEKQNKGVVVVCKTCKGTGETEQDVNLLMSEASFAIWYNIHVTSNKCKICSKDKLCDVAQKKYNEVMNKYKEIGPKIEKAACPKCMGMGTYTQYKGYRFGTEKID